MLLKTTWLKNELAWHFWTWLTSDSKSINWSIVAICVQWPADLHCVSVHLQHNTVDCAQTRTKSIFVHACEVSSEEDILHLKLLPTCSYLLLQKRLSTHVFHSSSFQGELLRISHILLMNKTRLKDLYCLWHQCYATQMQCDINVRESLLRNVFLGNALSDTSYASGII